MNINIVILFSIIFFLSEMTLMIVKRSKKINSKINNDKNSLLIFWLVIPMSITLGFMSANYNTWSFNNKTIASIGLFIFIIGSFIRWKAIIELADDFTVDVTITTNHKLKTTGLYQIVRHPSYFGLLLIVFGISLGMNSLFSVLVVTIPITLALTYRINIEEKALVKEFKKAYEEYKSKTKSLIPYVY